MQSYTQHRFISLALVFVLLTSFAMTASAYEIEQIDSTTVVGDFVVGPGKVEMALERGQSGMTELIVTNRIGETRTFSFSVEDAKGSEDPNDTVVLLGDDRGPYTLKDYVHIPEMSFELKHGERARIPVTVSVPLDAEPGGHYGSVLVQTSKKDAMGISVSGHAAAESVVVSRIGVLFFVTVPGAVKQEGVLERFATIPDKTIFGAGPISFELLFRNTGSIHLNPYGEIRIKNILGDEVGFVSSDPWFSFPQSLRFRELTWTRAHLFGYYTAEAHINRGYDDIIDVKTVSFMVLPWKILVGIFGALVIFFALIRFVLRNFEIRKR